MQDTVTKDREKYIGGSDEAAVMGISPFTTRFDLLRYKTGLAKDEFEGNEYTEYGNVMESKIRNYINRKYDFHFIEDKVILDDSDALPTRYHADGVDRDASWVLEVKTTSVIHENVDEYKYYLVQLLKGMYSFNANNGTLAVYERPADMSEDFDPDRLQVFSIGIEDHEELMAEILCADNDFRADYNALMENPWLTEAELPSRSQLMPIAQQIMGLENSIAQAQAIVKQYDDLKKEMCKQMEEHNVKSWTMPNGTKITLVAKGEDKIYFAFDEDRFKKEHEDLYGEYQISKLRKGKSAYVRVTAMAKGE